MPNTSFDDYVYLTGLESGGILFWGSATNNNISLTVTDVLNDGNVDSDDTLFANYIVFSGFYYTAPNGNTYAIYEDTAFLGDYYIPYNAGDYNLGAVFPSTGATNSFQAENFTPTGNPICFLAGSLIATPEGEVTVDTLQIGDSILTASGTVVPVKWIGRQHVAPFAVNMRLSERLAPVRIAAGALGEGLPHSDLMVTADHAMLIEGVLCHAGAVVNGTTITRVPHSELGTFTVYHIETDAHEIILANGAPAETFIDNVSRRAFDNYAEFEALYGDVPEMEELPYPRAMSARQVPARIRRILSAQRVA